MYKKVQATILPVHAHLTPVVRSKHFFLKFVMLHIRVMGKVGHAYTMVISTMGG